MMFAMLIFLIIALVALAAAVFLWRPKQKTAPALPLSQAKSRFHVQRERLEAKFLKLASARTKPDAPRWTDCNFADDVSYVRNRATGELSAFVAMTLATQELVADSRLATGAVGNLQAGTAVFRFDLDHWETDGRAILNLSPSEAVRHFRNWELVSEELAHRA
jgi:hypothetical protein